MWQRLFFHRETELSAPEVAAALLNACRADGYTAYDPFGVIPGLAYPLAIKAFAAPAAVSGWTLIIAAADPIPLALCAAVCAEIGGVGLRLALNADGSAEIGVCGAEDIGALLPDRAADARRIAAGDPLALEQYAVPVASPPEAPVMMLPLDALPKEVRAAIERGDVDAEQAQKMFAQMSGALGGRSAGAVDAEAAAKLMKATQPNWNSAGGQQIRALLGLVGLAAALNPPDYPALRDAYALHTRKRRKPDAPNYPGDAQTMAAVPDALAYLPVFAGKRG